MVRYTMQLRTHFLCEKKYRSSSQTTMEALSSSFYLFSFHGYARVLLANNIFLRLPCDIINSKKKNVYGVALTKARQTKCPHTLGKYQSCLRERIGKNGLSSPIPHYCTEIPLYFLFALVEKLQELKGLCFLYIFLPTLYHYLFFFNGIYEYHAFVFVTQSPHINISINYFKSLIIQIKLYDLHCIEISFIEKCWFTLILCNILYERER